MFLRVYFVFLCTILLFGCSSIDQNKQPVKTTSVWENAPYESTAVEMELVQVSPNAYYVQGIPGTPTDNEGFMSNAGVVITEEGVVILDALGTPSLAYLLLSKIREITDKAVVKVVSTHYHADHIYGLQVFKELGAEIIAPIGAKDYLTSGVAEGRLKERRESLFPWVDESTYVVNPDRFISEVDKFTLGGIDFILTPLGSTHSQGDLTMHVVQEHVLYAGDLIFEGRIPFVAGANPKLWIDNLAGLDLSKFKAIVPGHGPVSHRPSEAIKFTLGYLHFLYDNMTEAVENLVPFDEAYASLDWSKYENMPAAQVNRMNAYYVFLNLEASSVGN